MLDIVKKAIDQFYIKKDYNSFREKCKEKLELFGEIKDYAESCHLSVSGGAGVNFPSRMWYIKFKDYKNGNLQIT